MAAIRLGLAVAAVTVLAAGCGSESQAARVDLPPSAPPASEDSGPVVEVVPVRTTPPLDPNAAPTTPLGELRARYLPVWSSDFDWAFPPEVCGSDWPLDAIAEPTTKADLTVLGDPVAAAALSVMRYEHLLSRAMASPDLLGQLCVAVATVGTARTDALNLLASHLGAGSREIGPALSPDAVTIVATNPAGALGVACVMPGYPTLVTDNGDVIESATDIARLQAYLLTASLGLEDEVLDTSLRVSNVVDSTADGCGGLDSWTAEWSAQAEEWADAGELWGLVGRTVSAKELCASKPVDESGECPWDWAA